MDTQEELFDIADEYEQMLKEGLKYSGENRDYFIEGRLQNLMDNLPKDFKPKKILDFGCGTGHTTKFMKSLFPDAEIVGSEIAEGAIAYAQKYNSAEGVSYIHIDDLANISNEFDLCHTNGVFHHIPPAEREKALSTIINSLRDGAYFGFFENNPYNPGTRFIMSKIPFDKDAVTIKYKEGIKMLETSGFRTIGCDFLFYFPKSLSFLRPLEGYFKKIPMGAQYHILVQKKSA